MAVSGTGTQNDPYIITTYDELVEKAAESGKYLKIDNDINIIEEYPDGDMTQLVIKAVIDGNNKVISNWYYIGSDSLILISNAGARVNNLTFRNIYTSILVDRKGFIQTTTSGGSDYIFNNCNFSGVVNSSFCWDTNRVNLFKQCSFNLKCTYDNKLFAGENHNVPTGISCYIKVHCTKACYINYYAWWIDSYFEITADDAVKNSVMFRKDSTCFDNCVIDSYLTATETITGDSAAISIVNSTHAPNYSVASNIALVDDTHWLDVSYLANTIGFNAG